MRSLPVVLGLVAILAAGCSRTPEDAKSAAEPSTPPRAPAQYSYAQTNDLRVAPQFGSGWYPIEDGAWRWMGREAQLTLRAPESLPAQFEVRLALPKGHVAVTGPVEFSALFNGRPFAQQAYSADGDYTLLKTVQPGSLAPGPVRVTLRVSKARPPGTGGDQRELGAVIIAVGFK